MFSPPPQRAAATVLNRNSWWRYLIALIVLLVGCLYALPNVFGENPAVQVSTQRGVVLTTEKIMDIEKSLQKEAIQSIKTSFSENKLTIHFSNSDDQLKAKRIISDQLHAGYVVALNLAPAAPRWLQDLNANPMYLGLDLRGGVYFLMEVDVEAAINNNINRRVDEVRRLLRDEKMRYRLVKREADAVVFSMANPAAGNDAALELLAKEFTDSSIEPHSDKANHFVMRYTEGALSELRRFAVSQNIITLRNRVNELGVAEPVIQQQGANRIVVQLPGVQDTARAKDILGATATLEYRLVDDKGDPRRARQHGFAPPGTELYQTNTGQPILLKKSVIVTGENIINAQSGLDQESGSPMVSVTLDSIGGSRMLATTKRNVGNRMAVVFIESQIVTQIKDGQSIRKRVVKKTVINAAVIRGQFANRFQTTGLDSPGEARDLALLLRAGALAAPMEIVEERTIGPSLGAENIEQGFLSVILGLALVLVFMVIRYKVFGLVANVALCTNLVLIIATLSLLQATLTLPGIAGIVLTVGMAVDANVLIFERIREELKNGQPIQTAISAGYDRAFLTIADANITTLIAAVALFFFGTGPIKGFAITLSIGIVTSMFTAIVLSRIIVNRLYGSNSARNALSI